VRPRSSSRPPPPRGHADRARIFMFGSRPNNKILHHIDEFIPRSEPRLLYVVAAGTGAGRAGNGANLDTIRWDEHRPHIPRSRQWLVPDVCLLRTIVPATFGAQDTIPVAAILAGAIARTDVRGRWHRPPAVAAARGARSYSRCRVYPLVLIASVWGGTLSGLSTLVLSSAVADYLWLKPNRKFLSGRRLDHHIDRVRDCLSVSASSWQPNSARCLNSMSKAKSAPRCSLTR